MKAEELMVGDWVCYSIPNKYYTKIQEIRCTQDGEEYYIRCRRDAKDTFLEQLKYDDFSVDIIHPIPLTPEILKKNGWRCEYYGRRQEWWLDKTKFPIVRYSTNDTLHHNGIVLKYVHELQHALRLCNIDKEIVL